MTLRIPPNFRTVEEHLFRWWLDRLERKNTVTKEVYSNTTGFYIDGNDPFHSKLVALEADGKFWIPR